MSATLTPISPYVDATGIHAPSPADVLAYFQTSYNLIYGQDVYLGNDSQDGQFLGILATAYSDAVSAMIAVFNSYSPATAIGTGLDSVIKTNNMPPRNVGTFSTVDVTIVGDVGVPITNGQVGDGTNVWFLPSTVIIPSGGAILVTATASEIGAIAAPANTVNRILTPIAGWNSVTNAAAGAPGTPRETDAALRIRQATSAALPSQTILEGLEGALLALPGVSALSIYENPTNATDSNGLPPHSISVVITGGNVSSIAATIAQRKTPGCATYGTTTVSYTDQFGVPHPINFYLPSNVTVTVALNVHPVPNSGYTSLVGQNIISAIVSYINSLPPGQSVILSKLYVPANLTGSEAMLFEIESLTMSRSGPPVAADVIIAFNEEAACTSANVSLTLV